MPKAKVKLDLKTIVPETDIPVVTGESANLPAPVNGGPVVKSELTPTLEEALQIYWGPLSSRLDESHMKYFFAKCKLYGLNPLMGQAHAVPRQRYANGKLVYENGQPVYDLQFTVAYTAMIEIAMRQPDYRGVDMVYLYKQPDGTLGTTITPTFYGIIATGYIEGLKPIVLQAWWSELRVSNNSKWDTSPVFMTMKTAWMRILNLMYPGKFQGLYDEAEFHDTMAVRSSESEPPAVIPQSSSAPVGIMEPPQKKPAPAPKQQVAAPQSADEAAPAKGAPAQSPMDALTRAPLIPPVATPEVEPPASEEVVFPTQPEVRDEAAFPALAIKLDQLLHDGKCVYLKRPEPDYYREEQHKLLLKLVSRHFINPLDRDKILYAMKGLDPDGKEAKIEDPPKSGIFKNYLSVDMASVAINMLIAYAKKVEGFIDALCIRYESDIISNGFEMKPFKRTLGLICSDYTRVPHKAIGDDGKPKQTENYQQFEVEVASKFQAMLKADAFRTKYNETLGA